MGRRMRRIRRWFALSLLLSLCAPVLVMAQMRSQSFPSGGVVSGDLSTGVLMSKIGPGDILDVEVFDTPQLSVPNVRVGRKGNINLPVLGMVHVADMGEVEAAAHIESALRTRGLMLSPHVTVSVLQYAVQGATILGQVKAPGVYPTGGGHRLLDMIALAGGLAPSAGKVVTIIHRNAPHHPVNIILAADPAAFSSQRNPVIDAGDTVIVQRSGVVYILGDVGQPGAYMIDNNAPISLMQAISLAGGWKQNASLSGVRLIRRVPGGHKELKIDLKHVLRGKQANIRMKNEDILYIPSSVGKTLMYQGIASAFSAAQSLVYVGPAYY